MFRHSFAAICRQMSCAVAIVTASLVLAAVPAQAVDGVPDPTVPTMPGAPVVTAVTTHGFSLSWTPSTDDEGVVLYEVSTFYPPGSLAPHRSWQTTTNSITISDLYPAQTVPLIVRAYDADGNASHTPFQPMVTVRTAGPTDTVAPSAPGTPFLSNLTCDSPSLCTATLSWTPATDNVAVLVYGVAELAAYGGATIGSTTATSTTLQGLLKPGRTYVFVVFAMDPGQNRSPQSAPLSITVPPVSG